MGLGFGTKPGRSSWSIGVIPGWLALVEGAYLLAGMSVQMLYGRKL